MPKPVHKMTDAELEIEADRLDGHSCDYEDDCIDCKRQERIEREQDARELWNHSDDRVRESVGNYR